MHVSLIDSFAICYFLKFTLPSYFVGISYPLYFSSKYNFMLHDVSFLLLQQSSWCILGNFHDGIIDIQENIDMSFLPNGDDNETVILWSIP